MRDYTLNFYRKKLRHLEATLIEYRESLEDRGITSPEELERKVALQRKRLESDYGLSGSNEDSLNSKCLRCLWFLVISMGQDSYDLFSFYFLSVYCST